MRRLGLGSALQFHKKPLCKKHPYHKKTRAIRALPQKAREEEKGPRNLDPFPSYTSPMALLLIAALMASLTQKLAMLLLAHALAALLNYGTHRYLQLLFWNGPQCCPRLTALIIAQSNKRPKVHAIFHTYRQFLALCSHLAAIGILNAHSEQLIKS